MAGVMTLAACDGYDEARDATATHADTHDTHDTSASDTAETSGADADEVTAPEMNQLRNGVTATIAHIVDGDTFDVIVGVAEPRSYTIRMRGLSAPECFKSGMPTEWGWRYACDADDELYGLASYQALYAMLHGKTVVVTCDTAPGLWCPTDVYARYLAYVEVDGLDAATEMTRGGNGFAYTDYASSKRGEICQAEYDARDAQRGIWALGDLDFVLAGMHGSTQAWYREAHDQRCDAAIEALSP